MAAQVLETEVLKSINGNAPRHARGRPRKLTVAKFLRICALIEKDGKSNTVACRIEGVDYTTFRLHVRRKPWWQKRYLHADTLRDELLQDVYLGILNKHAAKEDGTWTVTGWLLERRWPHKYALHYTQHRTGDATEQPVGSEIPAEVLARHRALMLELAREDEAKQAQKTLCE